MAQNISVNKVHTFTGHKDSLYTLQPAGENRIASSGADGMVVLWDLDKLDKGNLIAKIPSSVYAMCYDSDKRLLIVGQNFEGIHLLDLNTKEEVQSIKLTETAIFDIQSDDTNVYVACGDGEIIIIEREGYTISKRIKPSDKSARTIAINNNHLSVGFSDNHIRVYDLSNYSLIDDIDAHKSSVFTLRYDPTNKWLLSGSRDAHLKIWDSKTYKLKESIVAHMYAINHIAYSPDGQHFVTCSMDKSIKVWDSHTFKLKKVIDKARHAGHGTSVNKLLWVDYNNYLTSCSDDRTISTWNIKY